MHFWGVGVAKCYYLMVHFSGAVNLFIPHKISSFPGMGLSGGILGKSQEGVTSPVAHDVDTALSAFYSAVMTLRCF